MVCLFIWSLSFHSRIFHSYGEVTIAGEGLQILTYARYSWPLSSEGSLACCDTGLPFIMVISEDPWHSHLLPSVWQWSCHYLFLRLRSVATANRTPTRRTLYLYVIAAVWRMIQLSKILLQINCSETHYGLYEQNIPEKNEYKKDCI